MNSKNSFLQGPWFPGLIVVFLGLVILWSASNFLRQDEDRQLHRVSVIIEDSANDRWTAFRLGIDQAAREYGIDVTITASAGFESLEDQKKLISQEVSGGTQALILSLFDSERTDILLEGVPEDMNIILAETDGIRQTPGTGMAAVTPSGRDMGRDLGQMLLDTEISAPSVAVVTGNLSRYTEAEILDGLTETVEEAGGSVLVLSSRDRDMEEIMDLASNMDLTAVLEDCLLAEAASLAETRALPEGRLFGIGCSPSNIYYLDRGIISGMVIPNEFTMGYQSLALLARRLNNDIQVMQDVGIDYACVLSEEVHDPANEKLLFPLVQ